MTDALHREEVKRITLWAITKNVSIISYRINVGSWIFVWKEGSEDSILT
jgi:hypothetical protein